MEITKINTKITNENKKIFKCLKSYLTGKKYYDTDIDKSFEYFKQCIKILNELKEQNIKIDNEFENLIEETESECSKYLTLAITNTLEKPCIRKEKTLESDNELFELIEIGDIHQLKNYKYGDGDFSIINEYGLTPLHYAIKYGDTRFLKQSFIIGAGVDQTNKFGHTLLEYACLEKDPNIINFLLFYGADMKKHLEFREGKKYFNKSNQIDIALIEKNILENADSTYKKIKYLNFIFKWINPNDLIDIGYCSNTNTTIMEKEIQVKTLILKLDNLIDNFDIEPRNTFLHIIKEELEYDLSFKLGCPTKLLEIVLYNIYPFIEFSNNLKLNWLISLEIKYTILKILQNKIKINTRELKQELFNLLNLHYVEPKIIPEGLIQTLVSQWVHKIKV